MYPVECVVRGYLSGSGLARVPRVRRRLRDRPARRPSESDALPEPIFTPATKAEIGEHDENIDFDRAAEIDRRPGLMEKLRGMTLELYGARRRPRGRARDHPRRHEVRVRLLAGAEVVLGDEVLTPGFVAVLARRRVRAGPPQPSFDKQYVRDPSTPIRLGPHPAGPELPREVSPTRARYVEAYERITGASLDGRPPRRRLNLFIRGLRRSGTTILYDALLADPELRCFYEPLREDAVTERGGAAPRRRVRGETRELREASVATAIPESR